LSGYSSFRGKELALIRGNDTSICRHCDECGAFIYFPMGREYLVADCLPQAPLCESPIIQLVINDQLRGRLDIKQLKKVHLAKISLAGSPSDHHDVRRCQGGFKLREDS